MYLRLFLLVVLLLGQMHPSNAAVKVGDKCSKVGLIVKSKPTNFICVKSGKVNRLAKVKQVATPTPTPTPTPTATAIAFKGDPVLEKLRQMIPTLKTNKVSENKGTINWILGPNVPAGYQKALEEQGNDLAVAFPDLYQWEGEAIIVVGDVFSWPVAEIKVSNQCKNFINQMISYWKDSPNLNNRLLGGQSYCDGQPITVIRPNPSSPQPDADLMAQELGVQIQANAIKRNPKTSSFQMNELVIPNWYLQGGQSAFALIAFAYKNKSTIGAIDKVYLSSECQNVSLNQMRPENIVRLGNTNCDYNKGFASVRLMIALYGWDATERWFSGFSTSIDFETAFLVAYGQSLVEFEILADAYWNYLYDIKLEPKDLITALNAAK